MYKIKISQANSDQAFNRQLPKSQLIWKDCHFYINDNIEEADFWVVCYQRLPNKIETCRVAPENTIFVTWEPDSVWHFSHGFLNQFGKVISCQEKLRHINLVKDQPGLAWHIGMTRKNGINLYNKTYDDFIKISPKKTKLISVISSNKSFSRGHRERIEFVYKLKSYFGEQMDIFGRGIRDFDDKWDVIAPYKYHICIENCSQPYYWSEKLADAFLGEAFPFYYGCTNIWDYFSTNSIKVIDIHKPSEAIQRIKECVQNNIAEQNIEEIRKAKMQVLNEYNFFELVHRHIQDMNPKAKKELVTIREDLHFFDCAKLSMITKRVTNNFKFKYFQKNNDK